MSNAVTNGSFGDFTFSASIANEAGELSAQNGGLSGGTRQNKFSAEWQFISADPTAEQSGLLLTVSPDRGDGARMSWVRMEDTPTGITISFNDYQRSVNNFVQTTVATGLSRTVLHTVKIEMDFVNGAANDVVRIYVDGNLSHTGTSWEDYYRDVEGNPTRTVDSLLFRQAGTAAPATLGKGFLVDNLNANSTQQSSLAVTPATTPTATDNDYTRINNAVQAIGNGGTITLNGTFNWTETNAAASWALGSDGQTGGIFSADNYEILVPANLNGVTLTASSLGAATIQGPGDLAAVNLEGVFVFEGGDNQNWTISNLRFLDFDLSIAMFGGAGGTDAFNDTKIINNYILTARDLNATVAPADVNQNIGIHFAFGTNQLISGNTIEVHGDGVSDSANNTFSTEVGMQSNTSGGNIYNGLQITNNIVRVLNAQSANPQTVLGIWENAHGHSSNITVSGNQFLNPAGGNNPSLNLQRAFRITSHSSATTTVTYSNNVAEGANIGFQWITGSNFTGNQPVRLTSNVIRNNATGVLVQSQGLANLKFNRIVGNSAAGVQNIDGSAVADNNWWGCNYGPGAGGAGCTGTANGVLGTVSSSPYLTLRTTATPNAIVTGGTSNISSNLNVNSDNVVTSGFVPNGTPANFTATLGTVSPTSSTTASGVTGTTFTAGAAAGSGSASTKIDGQTVSAPIAITFSCNTVSIPTGTTVPTNTQIIIPINVDDTTGRNIQGYSFTLAYNPAVVTPIAVETAGTLSNGWTVVTNNGSGTLNVVVFNPPAGPLSGAGVLLNVRFISTGAIGTTSTLSLSSFIFNEGVPCVNTSNGNITVISGTITGAVTYANAPTTRPVPNTTINVVGSPSVASQMTDANGLYSLSGFGAGAYTVTPSKANQINGIGNADATAVAQHIVGFITLNANQLLAADVTQNGTVSSLDATYIAQYAALVPNPGFTGTWKFIPASRSYPNVQTNQTNQDYSAILLGEVTGNWNQNGMLRQSISEEKAPADQSEQNRAVVGVSAPIQFASTNANFTVPISATNTTGENIFGYEFNLLYDQNVIVPQAVPCDSVGTLSAGRSITCNSTTIPGLIRVVVFSTSGVPISGMGTLLNFKFTVIGSPGATSPLTLQNFIFNEGVPMNVTTNGTLTISSPTAAASSISGTIIDSVGVRIPNALVTLTDSAGENITTLANSKGRFIFRELPVGEIYTITISAKGYTFSPQVINTVNNLHEVIFTATP